MEGFIRAGLDPRNWTERSNLPCVGVVPTGPDEISIYWEQHNRFPTKRVRRGTLRLDGFVPVHADYGGGEGDEYRVYYTYATSGTSTNVSWVITATLLNNSNFLGSAVVGVVGEPGDMQLHVVEMENSPPWNPRWNIYHDYYDWYEGAGGSRWKYIYLPLILKGYP